MPDLQPPQGTATGETYAAGDPWTADDASLLGPDSVALFDAARFEHTTSGPHDTQPIAKIAALVTWSGAAYSVTKGYNVTPGAGSVTRHSAGLVKVDHLLTLVANLWGARVEVVANDQPHFCTYTDPTQTTGVTVQIVDKNGAAADASFWLEVWAP